MDIPEEKAPQWGRLTLFAAAVFVVGVGWAIFELFVELPMTQWNRPVAEDNSRSTARLPDDKHPKIGKTPSEPANLAGG